MQGEVQRPIVGRISGRSTRHIALTKPHIMYAYSLADLKTAKHINKHAHRQLWPESFNTWAAKVMRWWNRFYQVLRAYARQMGGAALAAKAIWQNLRDGISLPKMLRDLYRPVKKVVQKWVKSSRVAKDCRDAIAYIRPRTAKRTLQAKCRRVADLLHAPNI